MSENVIKLDLHLKIRWKVQQNLFFMYIQANPTDHLLKTLSVFPFPFHQLFISQYHVWLAQDTKTLLVLLPGFPTLNLIVTSFIFVCVAVEIKDITGALTSIAIPNEPKRLYIRLALFSLLLAFLLIYTTFYH